MSIIQSDDDHFDDFDSEHLGNKETESVIAALEIELSIGSSIDGIEGAFMKYKEYGSCAGFGVRKGRQLYFNGTKDIRRKDFYCSSNGYYCNGKDNVEVKPSYSRQTFRTGCQAMLRIKRSYGEGWVVVKFAKDHNHELLAPDLTYLLRSARKVPDDKKNLLNALHCAGFGVSHSFRFMEDEAGGVQHVGFTKIDALNHANCFKEITRVKNGDANALMNFFMDKSNTENSFFWKVSPDSEGRIMNVYFRDSRCLTDYQSFGDVLMVDTTYRTNKYDIVVAPFVGVNHHKQNILFGIGFLSSETTNDFMWLFSVFLESMKGKQPVVIFTDQCQAMLSAIDCVFSHASHRLCQWHIYRNLPSYLGFLKNKKEFYRVWRRLMKGVESEHEFEQLWHHMIKKYSPKNDAWFRTMYNLRRRWASVFTQDLFSCGMVATSRCEATNHSLKLLCSRTNTLFEFVQCYERMKSDWRNREAANDVRNCGIPGRSATNNPLIRPLIRKLTRTAYFIFEEQMVKLLDYKIIEEIVSDDGLVINVMRNDAESDLDEILEASSHILSEHEDESEENMNNGAGGKGDSCTSETLVDDLTAKDDVSLKTHCRTVNFDGVTHLASCSCKMWETSGILCRHIFKVYDTKKVMVIPDCYILPRWCKDAKLRLLESCSYNSSGMKLDGVEQLSYANCFMKVARDVVDECKYNPSCRINSLKRMKDLRNLMVVMMDKHRSYEGGQRVPAENDIGSSHELRDPPLSKRRGKMKLYEHTDNSHWDLKKKCRKKKKTNNAKDKQLKKTIEKGAAIISSQLQSKSDCSKHWVAHEDEYDKTDIGGIFGTQQSNVIDSHEQWVGIADLWMNA